MFTWMATKQWPTSKKNGRIMIGHYLNTVGEPRSEIPHAPCLFLVGRMIKHAFILEGKDLYFTRIYLALDIETTLLSLF